MQQASLVIEPNELHHLAHRLRIELPTVEPPPKPGADTAAVGAGDNENVRLDNRKRMN